MDILYIVVPAYNESECIERFIDEWYPIVESHNGEGKSRLVIVNDGSKDNTYDIVCNYAKTRPLLVAETKKNGGHGSAVLYGYRYAIDNGANYVFQTDSDGQTNPKEFEQFWKLRKKFDALFGMRTARADGQLRFYVEKILCKLLRLYFGVKIPDANAPFRLMKVDYLKKYIAKMPENYNLPNVLFTMFGGYYHENICFIDITFASRQGGKSSINIQKIAKIGINALKDFKMIKKTMKSE